MPGMTGVQFLESAIDIYPEAKRVLLTAYADTEAAIQAINTARIHYYLTKPWDPPEEKLYPVLDDLLQDWNAGYQPKFEGLRVHWHRWSLKDHQLRSFCPAIMFRIDGWMRRQARMRSIAGGKRRLIRNSCRWCCFQDGTALVDPETEALAAKVGLRTQAAQDFYDIIVIGAGPAGAGGGGLRGF